MTDLSLTNNFTEQRGAEPVEPDHSACGVGGIVSLKGEASHRILQLGLRAGTTLSHRVGMAPDQELAEDGTLLGTSDGFGIIAQIPQPIFKSSYEKRGHPDTLGERDLAVATVFLPRDDYQARRRCREIFRQELVEAGYEEDGKGFHQCRWREIPIRSEQLGAIGRSSHPLLEHLMIPHKPGQNKDEFERDLYVIRRRVENRIWGEGLSGEGRNHFHIASMSARTIVYKSLSLAHRFSALYPDLQNKKFETPFVGFHGRFSTNTAPAWWRAHFKRMLAHNGEINTIRGNVNNMFKLERIFGPAFGENEQHVLQNLLNTAGADTDMLDNAFEFLVRAGVSLPLAKSILVPPAARSGADMGEDERKLYKYINSISPAWEGPAMLIMTDGKMLMGGSDLNVMRPTPWAIFGNKQQPGEPDILVIGSERGMDGLPYEDYLERGYLQPGDLIGANFDPNNVIGGRSLSVGFLPNDVLKQIAIDDAEHQFSYHSKAHNIVPLARQDNQPSDFSYMGLSHG